MKLFFPLFLNALLGGEQRRGTAFAAAFPGYDSAEVPQQRRQNGLVRGSNKNNVVMLVEDLPDHDHEPFTHRRELIEYITPDDITFIGDDSFGCDRDLADRDIYGCKKGEYAACYYQTSTSKGKKKSTEDSGEYHTTCWDYEKYGEPELGNSVGTSTDKYWAACAPCDCAPAITSQSPAPTIKVGKQEKKLQCPPVPIICGPDTDKDGIPDFYDNCPLVYNPDQTWVDYCPYAEEEAIVIIADLLGCKPRPESCIPDTDDDGVPDLLDNCPLVPNPDQDDIFGSGVGDACRCDSAKATAALYLATDEYPAQTSWTLKERFGVSNIASATTGTYQEQLLYTVIDMGCLDPELCYEFTISDSAGDGGPYYQISFYGVIYGQPTDFDGSVQSILFGACAFDDNQQALLHLTTDSWGSESSWSLAESGGALLASGPAGYPDAFNFASFKNYVISLGYFDSTGCYAFTIFDSFGDGICCDWGDGDYRVEFDGEVYERDVPFTQSSETILIGQNCICKPATLYLTTDDSPSDTAWELKRDGVRLASDDSLGNLDCDTEYVIEMGCFDPNDCYEFTILDSSENGLSGNGEYRIEFDEEEYSGTSDFGFSETLGIGACSGEPSEPMLTVSVAAVEKPIKVHTTLVSDAATHVAQLTVSVPFDQHVTVEITDAHAGAVVAALFDGIILADSPQVVSFDLGEDISTLKYKAEIKGENEAENITLYLFKPDLQGK